jgi:hypothetical protein
VHVSRERVWAWCAPFKGHCLWPRAEPSRPIRFKQITVPHTDRREVGGGVATGEYNNVPEGADPLGFWNKNSIPGHGRSDNDEDTQGAQRAQHAQVRRKRRAREVGGGAGAREGTPSHIRHLPSETWLSGGAHL